MIMGQHVSIKQSWTTLVAGAVLLILVSAGFIAYAISGVGRKGSKGLVIPTATSTASTEGSNMVPRRLDGVSVSSTAAALPVYAVMVENAPEARPLSGPAYANVVIEAPVEGGITRFILLFDASSTVSQIGPVRSARPYFVEWAQALQAAYFHVGGSPDALSLIAASRGFRNVDEMRDGDTFWRSKERAAPHNAYTNTDRMTALWGAREWSAGVFRPWSYRETTSTDRGDVLSFSIPYGGSFTVKWTYDPLTRQYIRREGGAIQKDTDGTPVSVANVVVVQTDATVLDAVGRLQLRTTGSGQGYLMRDGMKTPIVWRRAVGEWIRFERIDGSEAVFEPGKTWVSFVTSPRELPFGLNATSTQ